VSYKSAQSQVHANDWQAFGLMQRNEKLLLDCHLLQARCSKQHC